MLPEVLQTGKANPYLEYVEMQEVLIQNELVLFQDGKSSTYSTCHQVAGQPPEGGWCCMWELVLVSLAILSKRELM